MGKCIDLKPTDFAPWSNLGLILALDKDLISAEMKFKRGAELAADHQEHPFYLGQAWRDLAAIELHLQNPKAMEYITKAIDVYDRDGLSWALKAIAFMQLEEHMNLADALDYARQGDMHAHERDARIKRVRAIAHLRNKQFAEAVRHAKKAIDLGDEMAVIDHFIIAIAKAKLANQSDITTSDQTTPDQLAAAKTALQDAMAASPDDLKEKDAYRPSAPRGELWFDSANEIIQLQQEANEAIAQDHDRP